MKTGVKGRGVRRVLCVFNKDENQSFMCVEIRRSKINCFSRNKKMWLCIGGKYPC